MRPFAAGFFAAPALAAAFFAAMTLTPAACAPNPPPPAEAPTDVGARSLVRIYQDTPGSAAGTYTGRRIRVRFEAGQLKAADGGLGWFTGFDRTPPVILFLCDRQTDPPGTVEVVGVCRGLVHDGFRRGPGIDWHILVTDCAVTILPP